MGTNLQLLSTCLHWVKEDGMPLEIIQEIGSFLQCCKNQGLVNWISLSLCGKDGCTGGTIHRLCEHHKYSWSVEHPSECNQVTCCKCGLLSFVKSHRYYCIQHMAMHENDEQYFIDLCEEEEGYDQFEPDAAWY